MAKINELISKIRNAVFGIEVRDSIANAIDAINIENEETKYQQECLGETFEQLIINSGNSNAEIVEARGNYITLRKRLDSEKKATDARFLNVDSTLKDNKTEMDKYLEAQIDNIKKSLNDALTSTTESITLYENSNGVSATGTVLNLTDDITKYYDIVVVCDFNGYDYNNIVSTAETVSLRGVNIEDSASLSYKKTEFYEIGLRKLSSKSYEITRNNRIIVSSSGARTKEVDSEYSKIRKIYAKRKFVIS